jgi:hypothetical protein
MSIGIGLCTASATSAIMNPAPDEKQGVESAVNDTTREVGAALGIAIAGSILAAHYANVLTPKLSTCPEPLREPASKSLAQAIKMSEHPGPQGNQLAKLAKASFVDAMHSSVLALSLSIAIGAVLVGLWAPGRDGEQLRVVRWLGARLRPSFRDDELGGAVGEHHDRGVRTPAGDRRQRGAVDHPQAVDTAHPAPRVEHRPLVTVGTHRGCRAQVLRGRPQRFEGGLADGAQLPGQLGPVT